MTDDEPETDIPVTEKLEETEKGYKFMVKSKRGTGTNDRDEVEAELLTEERPDDETRSDVVSDVTEAINMLRFNQPDATSDN